MFFLSLAAESIKLNEVDRKIVFCAETVNQGERYMAGPKHTYKTDYRTVTIKTVDGSTIHGRINISPNQRVSDLLTLEKGSFLVVVNAKYMDSTGKTLFVNKDYIVWIEPED